MIFYPLVGMSYNKQEIDKKSIRFKVVTPEDIPLLFSWFLEPHVHQWWAVPEIEQEFSEYILGKVRGNKAFAYMVFFNDVPLGYIQYYYLNPELEESGTWLPELPEGTIGIDQIIGNKDMLGKGYGSLFIKEFIAFLSELKPDITTVIADPDADNFGAIKCYEKIGFENMGVYDAGWGLATLMRYTIK